MKNVTVKEFTSAIGISVSRLYALWDRNAGPPRIVGYSQGKTQPRVLIPLADGLAWEAERQKRIHPKLKMTGELRKAAAQAERERRARVLEQNAARAARYAQSPLYSALTTTQGVN